MTESNSKQKILDFLTNLNKDKKLQNDFIKKNSVEDSYVFAKKYLGDISFDDYQDIIIKLAKKIKSKNKLSVSDLTQVTGGLKQSYWDIDSGLGALNTGITAFDVGRDLSKSIVMLFKKISAKVDEESKKEPK